MILVWFLFYFAHSKITPEEAQKNAQATVDKMNLDEKISILHGVPLDFPDYQAHNIIGLIKGVESVGIPDQRMNDGPQGYRCDFCHGTSTAFPCLLGVAASFNRSNAYVLGQTIANEFLAKGANIALGPGMNLARVPKCGRNFEYIAGEDPTLGAVLAPEYIKGIQDKGIIAVAKHYIANNQEHDRNTVVAKMDWKTYMEMYAPMFEASHTEGQVGSFMCAYNKLEITGTGADEVNWACENKFALTKVLREMWDFKGWVMTDWGACHSTELAANAGLDQEMGLADDGKYFGGPLKQAVTDGKVSEDSIDQKVMNILYQMELMGVMNRTLNPDHEKDVTSEKNNGIARDITTDGLVLLKNENATLPMKSGSKVSVSGDPPVGGGGSGSVTGKHIATGPEGIERACPDCTITDDNKAADYIVFLTGTHSEEGKDRHDLSLPGDDVNKIQGMIDEGLGKKLIVVVTNPGAVLLPFSSGVAAIIICWMPGQEFGNAVGDVLFGAVNPSGKLPLTMPNEENEMKFSESQYPGTGGTGEYTEGLLVGYRWYDVKEVEPLYEFGFGLSYSKFALSSASAFMSSDLAFTVDLKNEGPVDGAEVVQIYITSPSGEKNLKHLRAFDKVFLKSGEKKTVSFQLKLRDVQEFDMTLGDWKIVPGEYIAHYGTSSRLLAGKIPFTVGADGKAKSAATGTPTGTCKDENAFCPGWAKTGECKTNAEYMKQICKLSCGVCSPNVRDSEATYLFI